VQSVAWYRLARQVAVLASLLFDGLVRTDARVAIHGQARLPEFDGDHLAGDVVDGDGVAIELRIAKEVDAGDGAA